MTDPQRMSNSGYRPLVQNDVCLNAFDRQSCGRVHRLPGCDGKSRRLRTTFRNGMLANMSEAFFVMPGEGKRLDLGNFEAIVLATAAQTSNEFTLLQTQGEPPEFGPPLHVHRDAAEAFYVLEGDYLMYVDDRQRLCPPGTFVYVPRGVPHTFKVVSAVPGKKLNLFSPSAMVGFFEDLAAAESAGTATPELLDAIADRNHMDVIGPVPDTYL
jgi:mannose-6-phosphate isomerase-like protein (cupin superfamily)